MSERMVVVAGFVGGVAGGLAGWLLAPACFVGLNADPFYLGLLRLVGLVPGGVTVGLLAGLFIGGRAYRRRRMKVPQPDVSRPNEESPDGPYS
jgi:hypothetical protein